MSKYTKFMKKSTLLLVFFAFLSIACHNEQNKTQDANTDIQGGEQPNSKNNVVKRDIPVTMDFFQITNISAADVVFTVGPYKVWEEGDSTLLNNIGYEFDGGVLTVTTPMEANNDMTSFATYDNVKVHVSCPELKTVAVCATGGFVCHDTIQTDIFQMGGMVKGNIDIDKVKCNIFRYESNGSTLMNLGDIQCEECVVISTGDGIINMSVEADEKAYFDIKSLTTANLTVNSKHIEGLIETKKEVNMDINTKLLELSITEGNVNLSGKAEKQNIRKGRLAFVNNSLK